MKKKYKRVFKGYCQSISYIGWRKNGDLNYYLNIPLIWKSKVKSYKNIKITVEEE